MKRRATAQSLKQYDIVCKECGLKFTNRDFFETHLHQHALEEEEEEEEEEEGGDEGVQTGDNMNPEAELDSGRVYDGENRDDYSVGDATGNDMSSSLQTYGAEDAAASIRKQPGSFYTCTICGKVYTYLLSFQKHQQLHDNPPTATENGSVQNLHKYQCQDCGLSFIREVRLRSHMRVHRSFKPRPLQCDHCYKEFHSLSKWMRHARLHRAKPFWCLSCAQGFKNEELLDKHLQKHNLRENICSICHESFNTPKGLRIHYKTHTRAKPYHCTFCGMSFYHRKSLMSHRKKHLRVYAGSGGMPLGIKNSAILAKKRLIQKKRLLLGQTEMHGMEEHVEIAEKLHEDAECGDHAESEESDCGEPLHHFKLSEPLGSALCDPPDEAETESGKPLMGMELEESDSQETNMSREHKYWEWECIECDMGFDEMAQLHLHYIKHATGELPIPHQDGFED